jgi:peptide/nickel transport system substrate-binding protein
MTSRSMFHRSHRASLVLILLLLTMGCARGAPPAASPSSGTEPGTAASPAAVEPKRGGILRIAIRNDPPAAWDTMRSTNYDLTLVTQAIGGDGNLVTACWDSEYKVCPALAESWESNSDATEWTFKIRDGVKWHDGVAFTAEDVRYWVDLFVNGATVGDKVRLPGVAKGQFGDLQKVETLDGNRVRITLNSPDAFYLYGLGQHRIPIFHPKHLFEPAIASGNVNVAPSQLGYVGTGPFKFKSYEPGGVIELTRFDQYWGKDDQGRQLPYLDGIIYHIIKSPAAMHAAFRAGQLDAGANQGGYYVTPDLVASYRQSLGDSVYFLERAGGDTDSITFNTLRPPFDDIRVRRAISLWVDRQSAVDTIAHGVGKVTAGFSDPAMSTPGFMNWPGYNPATKEADRAEAKRLLAEAGYANGLEFTIVTPSTKAGGAEWWTGALAGSGMTAKLEVMDVTSYDARRGAGDWQASDGNAAGLEGSMTPGAFLNSYGPKSRAPYASVVHEDSHILELARKLGQQKTDEGRFEVMREAEYYILQEKVYKVESAVGTDLVPVRSNVKGIQTAYTLAPNTYWSQVRTWLDK